MRRAGSALPVRRADGGGRWLVLAHDVRGPPASDADRRATAAGGPSRAGRADRSSSAESNTAFAQCVSVGPGLGDGGVCAPVTCDDYKAIGVDCGQQSDGCGAVLSCGTCGAPDFCGGGGPSKCGGSQPDGGTCVPKTCAAYPGLCGPQPDGCDGVTAYCNPCTFPQTCGGGGVSSVCGSGVVGADGGQCNPRSCQGTTCAKIADGCGAILDCGTSCPAGQVCGGAGTPNVCGTPPCTPIASCPAGMNCGSVADGCGGIVSCGGACTAPAICGGGGQPNVCGGGAFVGPDGGTCTPKTCADLGKNCGQVADGCGGLTADCGTCAGPGVCGGGGVPNVCGGGAQCQPASAATACAGLTCGFVPDGCGALIQCGGGATCANGGICGVPTPNVCSAPGGGACSAVGASCAQRGDCCSGFCGSNQNVCGERLCPGQPGGRELHVGHGVL